MRIDKKMKSSLNFILCLCLAGCSTTQRDNASTDHSKVTSLNEISSILRAYNIVGGEVDSEKIYTVESKIDLRKRSQQYFTLDNDCLQVVVPDSIDKKFFKKNFRAQITGSLLFIKNNSDGIYPWYTIDNVKVYPYCAKYSGFYFLVKNIDPL